MASTPIACLRETTDKRRATTTNVQTTFAYLHWCGAIPPSSRKLSAWLRGRGPPKRGQFPAILAGFLQIEALQACFNAHSAVVDEQIHVPDIFMPLNCHFCFSVTSAYYVLCAFSFPCNLQRSTSKSIEDCSLKEV